MIFTTIFLLSTIIFSMVQFITCTDQLTASLSRDQREITYREQANVQQGNAQLVNAQQGKAQQRIELQMRTSEHGPLSNKNSIVTPKSITPDNTKVNLQVKSRSKSNPQYNTHVEEGIDSNEDASQESEQTGFIQKYIIPVRILYSQLRSVWNVFKRFTDKIILFYNNETV